MVKDPCVENIAFILIIELRHVTLLATTLLYWCKSNYGIATRHTYDETVAIQDEWYQYNHRIVEGHTYGVTGVTLIIETSQV